MHLADGQSCHVGFSANFRELMQGLPFSCSNFLFVEKSVNGKWTSFAHIPSPSLSMGLETGLVNNGNSREWCCCTRKLLNAVHFDCSKTLSLVIVAARDNENEQLKCAASNLSMCPLQWLSSGAHSVLQSSDSCS